MNFRLSVCLLAGSLLTVGSLTGCSSGDMGTVTGTITLDTKPLPNALIQFYPKSGGPASQGRSDANGNYELIRDRETMGAAIGEYEVRISTAGSGGGDYGKPAPETVPAKYNLKSELKENVEGGKNVINFDLDSQGTIIQPK